MTLIELFRKFVNSLRGCDEEAGVDLLREFEAQATEQSIGLDFSLAICAAFLHVMMNHEKSLRRAELFLNRLTVAS